MSLITNFCIQKELQINCPDNPNFTEFDDEIDIIGKILLYLKKYLPTVLLRKKDCYERPIIIDPKAINVIYPEELSNYMVILVPTDDNSTYKGDNFQWENSSYSFELQLIVREKDFEGAIENLISLKSGIKTMLINMYENIGLNIEIDGFSLVDVAVEDNTFIRQGVYRFSIADNRQRINK